MFIIYKVKNKINDKCYIGQTKGILDKRIGDHISSSKNGSNYPFHNAIKKYSIINFEYQILDFAESKEISNEKEKYWIKFYNSKVPNGYNLTEGGNGVKGWERTSEWRKKQRESHIGKFHSEETKEKISKTMLGNKRPDHSERMKGENNPLFGKHHSDETRKEMSEAKKGKYLGKNNPMFGKKRPDLVERNKNIKKL